MTFYRMGCTLITLVILVKSSTSRELGLKNAENDYFSDFSENVHYDNNAPPETPQHSISERVAESVSPPKFNETLFDFSPKGKLINNPYIEFMTRYSGNETFEQRLPKWSGGLTNRIKRQTFEERQRQALTLRFPSVRELKTHIQTVQNFGPLFHASMALLPVIGPLSQRLSSIFNPNEEVQPAIPSQNGRLSSDFIEKSYCYGDIGCFTVSRDFYDPVLRPLNLPPESRERIATNFTLFTRSQPQGVSVDTRNLGSLKNTTFNPDHPTKLIIHGWLTPPYVLWNENLASALLKKGDYNVIGVKWNSTMFYVFMVLNTLVVALEVVSLLSWLSSNMAVDMGNVHIIGFSLGAHIAGYVGERIPGLGRITGLDAAGPYFQGMPTSVKLDPSDAVFVDVIHTDAVGQATFGTRDLSGHVDFFPNGGGDQPGCGFLTPPDLMFCSHGRAEKLIVATATSPCPFLAFPCDSYSSFRAGKCFSCDGPSGCAPMGIDADTWQPQDRRQVAMYLTTSGQPDYCLYHYRFTFHTPKSAKSRRSARGHLKVTLMKGNTRQKTFQLTKKPLSFSAGMRRSFLVRHGGDHSAVDGALLSWRAVACKGRCPLRLSHLTLTPLDNTSVLLGNSSSVVMCAPRRPSVTLKTGHTATLRADSSCPRS